MADVDHQHESGAGQAQPAAGRKPWVRPDFEVQDIVDTESGPLGGVDGSSSIS